MKGDPKYAERAEALSRKVKSFSEFLVALGMKGSLAEVKGTVVPILATSRIGSRRSAQPRALLKGIPGMTYKELPEADWCCGAAGSYTFLHHHEAAGVLDRKMGNVEKTGAAILATDCPACMMHLSYGARKKGLTVQVRHLSQLLDQAYAGAGATH